MIDYLKILKERAKESKVYSSHQLTGLMLAEILNDDSHKSLYMRLAKKNNPDYLLKLAKNVAEKNNIANKGAYFMKILASEKKAKKN